MRLLLDTHILIWALLDDRRLGAKARDLLNASGNVLYVSSISICEIAIKYGLQKGHDAPPFSGSEAARYCEQAGYKFLDLTPSHAATLDSLPSVHRDPFDRMLVAQALAEPLKLVTHDARLAGYGAAILLV